jgi:PAS domain S-box-containing protein
VGHDSWTFKEGAPADVTCLAQTNDGFLWLGGPNGLFRFDGTRFEPFSSPFGDRLLSNNLYSLFAPPSGGLWIGYTFGGFSFLDKGRVTNYASGIGSVYGFAQDRDGIVWAGTSTGLWRFDHSAWQHLGAEWNAPAERITQLGFDSEGILWALVGGLDAPKDLIYLIPGTRDFKRAASKLSVNGFTWEPDRTVMTAPAAARISDSGQGSDARLPAYPVTTKAFQMVDRNNGVWISPMDKPVVMRLPKDTLGALQNKASPAISETYAINPFQMAELADREGNIWFGDTEGIHRFFYTPLIRQEFPKATSESSDFAVVADDNGAVWISFGSSGSGVKADLYRVRRGKAELRLPQVTSSFAYRALDKTFWFSGERCLWHLVGDDFVRVNLPPEMVNQYQFLQTITEDRQGGVWVSFGRHGLYRFANGSWTPYGGRDDLPKTGSMMIAFTDSLGRVWFGYAKSQLAVLDGDRARVFGPGDGLKVGNITAIYGRGPEIWMAGEFGLEQFDQGRFHKIAAMDDRWLHGISGIVETREGDLWLNAISGIFHIRKAEISEALKDSAYRVKGEHFGRREGLSGIANQLRPLPTAIEGDGRLWFTLRNGVVWLDPAAYSEKRTVPAPITIQSVSADDKGYALDARLSFPAHTSSVQVSYAAVSLSDPEAIRFRYKLQETDKDWNEAAAATPVTYRNLPPGSYHFSVEASDTNGIWSGAPANMAFTILPAFYQTTWFRLLCVAAFLVFLWGLYQLRVQQFRREEGKLREAIETIPAMAWIAGPDGALQFVNRRWVEYTGLSQLEAEEVRKVAIHPDDLDRIHRRMEASFASGEPFEEEMRIRRTDGEYRWFLSRAVPLQDKRGKVVKWYGAATDIQDRKRAEELQADLAHTNRVSTMGELVASISHELAQPLTITTANAKASLRWLQRDPPDVTEALKGTESIIEAGTLASEIIDRLRSLYKKSPPKRELVAINEVIGEMVLLLRGEANENAVSIRTDLAADLPKITADRVQLQQVLMNLMLNGIEAMKETGGVLTLRTGRCECDQVLISLSDTGVGLPAGKADELFNAFVTTKPQGSGMGLAISKSIVESHGGRIWANGDGGRGATFHFTLPAAPAETSPPVEAA